VVLSLWRDNVCAASFRLAVDEVRADAVLRRSRPGYAARCARLEAFDRAHRVS
jgi:hypothetical protein